MGHSVSAVFAKGKLRTKILDRTQQMYPIFVVPIWDRGSFSSCD